MTRAPSSVRAVRFPAGYSAAGGRDSILPWSYVEERLRAASNYWIATVGPDARPHVRPVDGVRVDGAFCFGGSPEAHWVRNPIANPCVSVHFSSEAEAVIVDGIAVFITDQSHPLAAPATAASRKKYPQYFSGDETPFRPFWALRPTRAFVWTLVGFPRGATGGRFENS
jgi:pyridoxamine 5'-phosphate oxidase-like protein